MAAPSGIGTTAIQLAKAFEARVLTTVGAVDKAKACLRLGADLAIVYHDEDFVVATLAATGGKGADVILDMVGGDYVARNYAAAAPEGGRIVQIAFLRGGKPADRPARRSWPSGSSIPARRSGRARSPRRRRSSTRCKARCGRCSPTAAASPLIDSTFPLARGRRRPPAHRQPGPCRQDRADALTPMPRYKLTIEYDGTDFAGWQRQENGAVDPAVAGGGDRAAIGN